MSIGELIVRWTARLAAAAYLARISMDVLAPGNERTQRWNRAIWIIGCVIFLAHVAAAFHFAHRWSHSAAVEHVRQQTLRLTGFDSGFGLYLNELMAVWWTVDAVCWARNGRWPENRWAYWSLHAFFAFMMFNATVVFGPRGWDFVWLGWLAGLAIVAWSWRGTRNRKA
ncbi:MAG TPA: hypothetical protein VFG20_07290 [Planctomycetaceae bacterium]|nr:hypothetical protein [Planctomycetaceae bacterium]